MPYLPTGPGGGLPADPSPEPAPDGGRRPPESLPAHDLQNPGDVSPSSSKQSCSSSLADSRSDPARTPHPHRRHPMPLPGTTRPADKPATTTPGNTSSSTSMSRSPPPTAVTSSPSLTRCQDPDTTQRPSTCVVGKTSSTPPAPPGSPTPPTSPPPPPPRSRSYPTSPAPTTTKTSTLPSPEPASTSNTASHN